MNGSALVIGFGNPLRGDDGAGWQAVTLLAGDSRLAGARLLARHQLTPELAADLAQARLAVFIDARADGPAEPGTMSVDRLEPGDAPPPGWSHHLEPGVLVGLAAALYGVAPPAFLITVTGAYFGHSDQLSPAVGRALPKTVDVVAALLTSAPNAM